MTRSARAGWVLSLLLFLLSLWFPLSVASYVGGTGDGAESAQASFTPIEELAYPWPRVPIVLGLMGRKALSSQPREALQVDAENTSGVRAVLRRLLQWRGPSLAIIKGVLSRRRARRYGQLLLSHNETTEHTAVPGLLTSGSLFQYTSYWAMRAAMKGTAALDSWLVRTLGLDLWRRVFNGWDIKEATIGGLSTGRNVARVAPPSQSGARAVDAHTDHFGGDVAGAILSLLKDPNTPLGIARVAADQLKAAAARVMHDRAPVRERFGDDYKAASEAFENDISDPEATAVLVAIASAGVGVQLGANLVLESDGARTRTFPQQYANYAFDAAGDGRTFSEARAAGDCSYCIEGYDDGDTFEVARAQPGDVLLVRTQRLHAVDGATRLPRITVSTFASMEDEGVLTLYP